VQSSVATARPRLDTSKEIQLQNLLHYFLTRRGLTLFIPVLPVQSTTFNEDIIQEREAGGERLAGYWIAIKLPTKVIIRRGRMSTMSSGTRKITALSFLAIEMANFAFCRRDS